MDDFLVRKIVQVVQCFKNLKHNGFCLLLLEFSFLFDVFWKLWTFTVLKREAKSRQVELNDFIKLDNIGMTEFLVGLTLSEQMFQIHVGTGLGHFRPRTQLESHKLAIGHIKRPVYLTVPPAAN